MVIFIYFKTLQMTTIVRARRRPRDRDRASRSSPRYVSTDGLTNRRLDSTRLPGENAEGEGTRRTRLGRPGVDAAFTLSRTRVER